MTAPERRGETREAGGAIVSEHTGGRRTAGVFDVRTIVALVLGIFGAILLVVGLVDTPQSELDKAGGLHANLIAGIALLVVALAFGAWSLLRPTVVANQPSTDVVAGQPEA